MPDAVRELRDLRRAVARTEAGDGRRYPLALRIRILAWTAARRARGAWWCDLSAELGVPARTLARWAEGSAGRDAVLRPVEVIDATPLAAERLTVVTRTGLRLEDVTVADAITILQALA